jgi:hypothetical protein
VQQFGEPHQQGHLLVAPFRCDAVPSMTTPTSQAVQHLASCCRSRDGDTQPPSDRRPEGVNNLRQARPDQSLPVGIALTG